jgi:hypothetical protein
MMLRRAALPLIIAVVVIAAWVRLLRPKINPPALDGGNESANVTVDRRPASVRPAISGASRSETPTETELDRLESEFYRQFPLALKFRNYQDTQGQSAEIEAIMVRLNAYADEPGDVRTKNLRTGNLNIILELETPLLFKELLETDSELGQMLRVAFNAPQWDWAHLLRNLDNRIGSSAPTHPVVEAVEQFLAAIQKREERILNYSREKQEEAVMPDSIREDIRQLALDMLTRGVTKAYLETVTPGELTEERRRVAHETKERSQR